MEAIDEEGYCEEGVGYWQYGFGFFTLFFDVYTQLTGEKPAILSTQKVKNLVQYMQNSQMGEQVYLPFADGGTKFFLGDGQILCAIKTLFGTLFTIDLSAKMKLLEGNYRALAFRLLYGIDKFSSSANEKFEKRAAKTFYYNKAQVFVYKNANYAFAAKGGHNLELHNHNDVGAFQIVKDEKRLLVDIGCGEYTRQYFSDERYSIFVCSSFSHCVPIIGENGQKAGKEYCGDTGYAGRGCV